MNKAQFIAYLAPQFGDSKKEAARAVDVVFDAVSYTHLTLPTIYSV